MAECAEGDTWKMRRAALGVDSAEVNIFDFAPKEWARPLDIIVVRRRARMKTSRWTLSALNLLLCWVKDVS